MATQTLSLKLKGLKGLARKEKLRLANAIKKSKVMDDIGEDIIKVSKKAKREPLPSGKKSWSKRRDKLAAKNPTDPTYASGKSNLTFTGQLLNSIKVKFMAGKFLIRISPTGTHKKYKSASKRKGKKKSSGKRSSNMDIAIGHETGKLGKSRAPKRPVIIVTKKTAKKYGKWIKKKVGRLFLS